MNIKEAITIGALGFSVITTGCLDTARVNNMKPGETIELSPIHYGDDFELNCEITRLVSGEVVIDANFIETVDRENELDRDWAFRNYGNQNAIVTGSVDSASFLGIDLLVAGETIDCDLKDDLTRQEYDNLEGKTITIKGKIKDFSFLGIQLYDCEIQN